MNGRGDTIYFISDAHFGLDPDESARIERLRELAAQMRERATDVFILGDMFDFWIEYRHVIRSDYFPVLYILRGLVDSGVRVYYLTGNHDFALSTFLEKTIGITILHDNFNTPLQGRKAHLRHGDDIPKRPLVASLLRNEFFQAVYRMLHPIIGIWIGRAFSMASRKKHRGKIIPENKWNKYRNAAQAIMKTDDRNLVVFAHTHHAELLTMDEGIYCNTGSWMEHYTYATLRDGKIELMQWKNGNGIPYTQPLK